MHRLPPFGKASAGWRYILSIVPAEHLLNSVIMRGWITPDALARRAVNEPEKDELPKSNTSVFLDFCLPSTKLSKIFTAIIAS